LNRSQGFLKSEGEEEEGDFPDYGREQATKEKTREKKKKRKGDKSLTRGEEEGDEGGGAGGMSHESELDGVPGYEVRAGCCSVLLCIVVWCAKL